MSLEESITRLAVATEKLVTVQEQIFAAVTGGARPTTATAEALAPTGPKPRGRPAAAPAPAAASAPSSPSPGPAAASGSPSTPTPAPVASQAADGAVKYDTVREAVIKLAEVKGHQVAVGVLAKFGAKNGKDVKPAEWPKLLAEVETAAGMTIAALTGKADAPIA